MALEEVGVGAVLRWGTVMSTHCGTPIALGLDWNGTVVDDDERARQAAVAVLDQLQLAAPGLESVAGFRSTFSLPLARYFRSLGVPEDAVSWAVSEWSHQVRIGPKPELVDGAERLLDYANEVGIAVHVVSGAAYEAVISDVRSLIPNAEVASVQGAVHPKRSAIGRLTGPGEIAVYIGDTMYDVEEALAAGAVAIGLAHDRVRAARLRSAGARLVITSLDAAVPFLRGLAEGPGGIMEGCTHA